MRQQTIVMVNNTYVSSEDKAKQVLKEADEALQSHSVFKEGIRNDILKFKKQLDKVTIKR